MQGSFDLFELLEQLSDLFANADGAFESFGAILTAIALIFEVVFSSVSLIIIIVGAILSAIYALAVYLLRAIPHYAIAKKVGCKQAWLVWIPFFQKLLCTFVLSRCSDKPDFVLLDGKFRIKDRNLSVLAYVLIYFFGSAIITLAISIISIIPFIGQIIGLFTTVLYFVPAIALDIIAYVYLRDVLDIFKPDAKQNQTHSFIVTILDSYVTFGWATVIYLFTMMKLTPLPKETAEQAQEA